MQALPADTQTISADVVTEQLRLWLQADCPLHAMGQISRKINLLLALYRLHFWGHMLHCPVFNFFPFSSGFHWMSIWKVKQTSRTDVNSTDRWNKTFIRVPRNGNILQIHLGLLQMLWKHRMGEMCKVGIIMMKLQGSDRKQNRRLMANRAKTSPCSWPWNKGIACEQQRRKGAAGGRGALANQEIGLWKGLTQARLILVKKAEPHKLEVEVTATLAITGFPATWWDFTLAFYESQGVALVIAQEGQDTVRSSADSLRRVDKNSCCAKRDCCMDLVLLSHLWLAQFDEKASPSKHTGQPGEGWLKISEGHFQMLVAWGRRD